MEHAAVGRTVCKAVILTLLFAFASLSQTPKSKKPTKVRYCSGNFSLYWNTWDNCIGASSSLDGSAQYVGEFHENRWNGKGTLTAANGGWQYVGDFLADKFNGQGTLTYADGTKYVGQFRDGKYSGQGTLTNSIGKYVGGFRDNAANGQGTMTYANGDKYVGDLLADKLDGQGTITYANGDKYIGQFRNGSYNGQGTYTFANGKIEAGQFVQGKYVEPVASPSSTPAANTIVSIPLIRQGGVLTVPATINGRILLEFIIDSGASDVSIPADVVSTLWRTGTLTDADFTGSKTYVLADGSTMPSATFRIKSLRVGDRVLENVSGSVAPPNGSLLLGQSFLSRFTSWSVDNIREVLVLQ